MARKHFVVLIVGSFFLIGAAAIVGWKVIWDSEAHAKASLGGSSFEALLDSFDLTQLPDMPAEMEPGTLLRIDDAGTRVWAYPKDAFEQPALLGASWKGVGGAADYVDSLNWESEVSVDFLNFFGLGAAKSMLKAEGVLDVRTSVRQMRKQEPSEIQFQTARLKKDISDKLGKEKGVIIVQAVYRVGSLDVAFGLRSGLLSNAKLGAAFASVEASARSTSISNGRVHYTDSVVGIRPLFRMGGDGSDVTDDDAKEIASTLALAGVKAMREGNVVLASPTPGQLKVVAEYGRQTVHVRGSLRKGTIGSPTASADLANLKLIVGNNLADSKGEAAKAGERVAKAWGNPSGTPTRAIDTESLRRELGTSWSKEKAASLEAYRAATAKEALLESVSKKLNR